MARTIKISQAVYDKVKANKEKTKVPIVSFVEMAIEEKLEAEREKK